MMPPVSLSVFQVCLLSGLLLLPPVVGGAQICDLDSLGNAVQLDSTGVCGGGCDSDFDGNGICDTHEVFGCTYNIASNFDTLATQDNGSCIFPPCYNQSLEAVFDWDENSEVNVADFLVFLSLYGSTDSDNDNIWDAMDVCVGQYDECGVCNGPGPSGVVYDVIYFEDSVLLVDSTWSVVEIADTIVTYTCPCEDHVSYQGYDYQTVSIGVQCWFAENLRSTNYRNGDFIASNLSPEDWITTEGRVTSCDEEYGRLYNWWAVNDNRYLCPVGWHVPNGDEWEILFDFLGGWQVAGEKMKHVYGWGEDGNGSNDSGFSALPGGVSEAGECYMPWWPDLITVFWASWPGQYGSWAYGLRSDGDDVSNWGMNAFFARSVRCIKD